MRLINRGTQLDLLCTYSGIFLRASSALRWYLASRVQGSTLLSSVLTPLELSYTWPVDIWMNFDPALAATVAQFIATLKTRSS